MWFFLFLKHFGLTWQKQKEKHHIIFIWFHLCLSDVSSYHLHAQLQEEPSPSATPHHLQTPHLHHGPEQHRVHAGRLPWGTAPSWQDVDPWGPQLGPGSWQGPLQLHRQPGQHQGRDHRHGGSGADGREKTPIHGQPQLGAHLRQSHPGVQSWGVLKDTSFFYRDTGQSQHTNSRTHNHKDMSMIIFDNHLQYTPLGCV